MRLAWDYRAKRLGPYDQSVRLARDYHAKRLFAQRTERAPFKKIDDRKPVIRLVKPARLSGHHLPDRLFGAIETVGLLLPALAFGPTQEIFAWLWAFGPTTG